MGAGLSIKFYLITKLTLGIWVDDGLVFDSHTKCRSHANIPQGAGMIVICEPRSIYGHISNNQSSDISGSPSISDSSTDANTQG